ncbi:DMT family transporter [Streptomyces sp. NPDC057253]|uniref:DMT family transporter n=1 Tax=Streptomyces sp. NPDC057253 TaxID=3346069 RepID=UPI003638C6FF
MSALALSVLLSLVSAVAYAGGAIVQEQVAVSHPDEQYAPLRRPSWWAAVALNGLGGLLHVVALAYGPLSLVQPLGALTIVFALPMAALFVGRRAGATAWRGAIMATVGLAGLLSLVGAADAQSLSTAQRVFAGLVTAAAVVALMIAGRAAHRHPAVRSVLLATASGIAFGMSSVFTKTVAVDWSGGIATADLPSLAAIGVLATAGLMLSQASYRGAGLAAPLATLTVVNPVVAAAVGITMFGETFRYGTTGTALALSCGVVAAGGLILLTTERIQRTHAEAEPTAAEGEDGFLPAAGEREDVLLGEDVLRGGDVLLTAAEREGGFLPAATERETRLPSAAGERDTRFLAAQGEPEEVFLPAPAESPADALVREGVLVEQVAALREELLVPAPAAPAALTGGPADERPASRAEMPTYYGPFYGAAYIPLPMLDRHRARVKS